VNHQLKPQLHYSTVARCNTIISVYRCVFPHLHDEAAWEEFYSEFAAAGHDLDIWLQRKLLDDAMPDGMSAGMYAM
jgi:hypothetical protein